ncbi:MAG: hypothetical protein HS111_31395 [Kofleriaceae bacterium]|nr:hypothetical protein [Kofleriaceae bacterium]
MIRAVLLTSSMLLVTLVVACGGFPGAHPRRLQGQEAATLGEAQGPQAREERRQVRRRARLRPLQARPLARRRPPRPRLAPGRPRRHRPRRRRGTSDEGEGLDLDVGAELLDGASWNVLARSSLETDDAHDLRRPSRPPTPRGPLLHPPLPPGPPRRRRRRGQGRLRPRRLPWKSDFPNQVAFVDVLPAIPPLDDAPEPARSPGSPASPRPAPTSRGRTPRARADRRRRAGHGRISNVEPDAGGGTLVTIGAGTADGLENGLSGSIKGVRNSSFRLSGCNPATCRAKVKAPIDDVRGAAG